jgi:hypothetical protein
LLKFVDLCIKALDEFVTSFWGDAELGFQHIEKEAVAEIGVEGLPDLA